MSTTERKTLTLQEMTQLLAEKGLTGESKRKARSESIQNRRETKKYGFLKKELGKSYMALILQEIALPFNPETGKADDTYHADNKYRPLFTVSTMMGTLKNEAKTNADLKAALMSRSGVKVWDIDNYVDITPGINAIRNGSDVKATPVLEENWKEELVTAIMKANGKMQVAEETIRASIESEIEAGTVMYKPCYSDVDYKVFKPFIVDRIFTVPTVKTTLPSMLPPKFREISYIIDIMRDEFDNIVKYNEKGELVAGETPLILKAFSFFSELAFKKLEAYEEAQLNLPAKERDDEKKKTAAKRDILNENPVKPDMPSNYYVGFAIEVGGSYELIKAGNIDPSTMHLMTNKEFIKEMKFFNDTKGMRNFLKEVKGGAEKVAAYGLDFIHVNIKVPSESSTSGTAGTETTYTSPKPENVLSLVDVGVEFMERYRDFIDSEVDMEDTFLRTIRMKKYGPDIETALANALRDDIDIETLDYLTPEVAKRHAEFLFEVYGDNEFVQELTANIDEIEDGATEKTEAENKAKYKDATSGFDVTEEEDDDSSLEDISDELKDMDVVGADVN